MRSRTASVSSMTSSSSSSSATLNEENVTVIEKKISATPSSDDPNQVEFLYEQNYFEIRDRCLKENKLFEDPEFPPDEVMLRTRTKRVIDDLEWLRPSDFVRPEDPILISDRNEGFYIKTSLDGWFVPAMSAIAESESLLKQVIPQDQGFTEAEKYVGIFRFRFWFGRWIEIVIDDRLPVRKGVPIYMRSASSNEMWPALLEKAYAKAKGSYELLNHWLPVDGCIELTGGIPERVKDLPSLLTIDADGQAADRLFFDLVRASQLGNIVLVSPPRNTRENKMRISEGSQLGLEMTYIYRVTQVANLGDGRQVIRVKNCSGQKSVSWTGAWNPDDTRWANLPDGIRRELDAETFHDGGFWMAYGDFLKYFQNLDICHINHSIDQEITFHGRWENGLNAGGVQKGDFRNYAKNPQCFIKLSDPDPRDPSGKSSAIISLMQRRQTQSRVKGTNKIGFKLYRVDDSAEELNAPFFSYRRNDGSHKCICKTPTWSDGRETNLRVRLTPGKYCIIPSTFQPDQEGDFILRVHIERYSREIPENHMTLDLERGSRHSLSDERKAIQHHSQ